MAHFLVGQHDSNDECTIVDTGHVRARDLALEVPSAPIEAVMSNEVWEEIYDRLEQLINEHRTTLIFVNTRRLAERAARRLAERIGGQYVTAHHGSLSREHRLDAEQRVAAGASASSFPRTRATCSRSKSSPWSRAANGTSRRCTTCCVAPGPTAISRATTTWPWCACSPTASPPAAVAAAPICTVMR